MAFRHPAARAARLDSLPARRGRFATSKLSKSWYPTRDSNPEHRVSETRAYSVFRQRGTKTKEPGHLEGAKPGSGNKKARSACAVRARGSERYCASSPPRPNAQGPRRTSGDPSHSVSYVVASLPRVKRARILLIARAKVNTFFRERGDKKSWRSVRHRDAVRYNITPCAAKRHLRCAIVHCSDDSRRAACFPTCRIFPPAFPPPAGSS
jgi:hypothetical protein